MAAKARVPVYFASTPIYRAQASLYVGDTPLGVMESKLPARNPGKGVRFIDAAQSVELNGHYTDTLPCLAGEKCTGRWPDGQFTVVVREADGGHFCPVKEVAYWRCLRLDHLSRLQPWGKALRGGDHEPDHGRLSPPLTGP